MRYYHIKVSYPNDPEFILNNGQNVGVNAGQIVKEWSSIFNGKFDSGALNIVVDIPLGTYASPLGHATVMIQGISLQALSNASDFSGLIITIDAGMSSGLPLAKQSQHGLILSGQIFQSFGNWQGTEMSLNFVVSPSPYTYDNPGNLALNWKANTPLDQALKVCLSAQGAYPNTPIKSNIANYIANHDQIGVFHTLEQLASVIYDLTTVTDQNGKVTQGVNIAIQGGTINIFDATSSTTPTHLLFTDFVGQPVWISTNQIQLKLVMRGDLTVGGTVILPSKIQNIPGAILTSANAFPSQTKNSMNFNGLFYVSEVRHVGDFRSGQGDAWVTIVSCLLDE